MTSSGRLCFLLFLIVPLIFSARTSKQVPGGPSKNVLPATGSPASVSSVPHNYGETVPLPHSHLPAYNSPHLRPTLHNSLISQQQQQPAQMFSSSVPCSTPQRFEQVPLSESRPVKKRAVPSVIATEETNPTLKKRKLLKDPRELDTAEDLDEFEELQKLCNDGNCHKIPLDRDFFADRDPSDYLGLAIRAHDAEAIDFCKDLIVLEASSSYLQSAIIDAILREEIDVIKALGRSFPSIFTTIYAFHPPYANLSGTSLIRIAVNQNRPKSAKAMLKFIPVAMIGDFWKTIDSMKRFIVTALHTGDINLTPTLEGDTGIDSSVLAEMYYTCVLEGDLEAITYLLAETDVPVDTMFTGESGITVSAMFIAAHVGNFEMVRYLYKKCPALARIPSSMGTLPIHMAAGNGHMDVVKILSAENDLLTYEITIAGIKYTPFSLAIRNEKRNVADLIISLIKDQDNKRIQKEMAGLAYWAILGDNVDLLDIYFDFDPIPSSGCMGEEYNLLEMAILGIIDPKQCATPIKKVSSLKCVIRLIEKWIENEFPFRIHHEGEISGSILGLVYPNDLDVFESLISRAKIDPNSPILVTTPTGTLRTTFLNRIISLGATNLVPYAISRGCDPRILDSDDNDAIAVARNHHNTFVLEYFKNIYK